MHNNSDYYSNSLMIFVDPNSILEGKAQYFNLSDRGISIASPSAAKGFYRPPADGPPEPVDMSQDIDFPFLTGDETYSVETTKQPDQVTIPKTGLSGPKFGGTGY